MNETVDLSVNIHNVSQSTVDISVANVFSLYKDDDQLSCAFSVMRVESAGLIKNGLVVVNVSLDFNNSTCQDVYVSIFDGFYGSLQNLSVTGFINLTNVTSAVKSVRLSRMFGNLGLENNSAGGQRYVGGPNLVNISSSLAY